MCDHLKLLELINESVSDAVHEFLDAIFENVEKNVRSDLKTPFFESFSQPQELLKVLRKFVIIVDTIEAELDI